jgi:hypothetical protein
MNRVRAGSVYTFRPVALDLYDSRTDAQVGDRVRVVNLRGAPKANTMNHCHIESLSGDFLGMVHVNSLVKE